MLALRRGTSDKTRNRVVVAVFAAAVAFQIVERLWLTRHDWFYLDDWPIMAQAAHVRGWLHPYNSHLSVVLYAVYRADLAVFGFSTYMPLRVFGALAMATVPVAMYVTVRRSRPPLPAALFALPFVWFHGMTLEVAALNLWLSLAAGIVCAALLALPSTRRNDLALAGCLGFSLLSAGSGLAVAAACLVYCTLTRAPFRRWLATVGPLVVWGLWWLRYRQPTPGAGRPHGFGIVTHTIGDVAGSFQQLAFGNRLLGGLLFVVFAVHGVRLVRAGKAAGFVTWSAALVVWWFGVVVNRGFQVGPAFDFRYSYLAGAFILLAVAVPAGRLALPEFGPVAAAGAVTVAAVVLALSVQHQERSFGRWLTDSGHSNRGFVVQVNRGGVPDMSLSPVTMYFVPVGTVRALETKFGG